MVNVEKVGDRYYLTIGSGNKVVLVIDESEPNETLAELRKIEIIDRDRGYGTRLVRKTIEISRRENVTRIWGQIGQLYYVDEDKARHILDKLGFIVDKSGYFYMNLK